MLKNSKVNEAIKRKWIKLEGYLNISKISCSLTSYFLKFHTY